LTSTHSRLGVAATPTPTSIGLLPFTTALLPFDDLRYDRATALRRN